MIAHVLRQMIGDLFAAGIAWSVLGLLVQACDMHSQDLLATPVAVRCKLAGHVCQP